MFLEDINTLYFFPSTRYYTSNPSKPYAMTEHNDTQSMANARDKNITTIREGGLWYFACFRKDIEKHFDIISAIEHAISTPSTADDHDLLCLVTFSNHIPTISWRNASFREKYISDCDKFDSYQNVFIKKSDHDNHAVIQPSFIGLPAITQPMNSCFSPNNEYFTYLAPDASGTMQLNVFTMATSVLGPFMPPLQDSGQLSYEEQLRRERLRLFTTGISTYIWSPNSDSVLIPMNGQILIAKKDMQPRVVYDGSKGTAMDATWSPNGRHIAFILNKDIYVIDINGKCICFLA
jgi:hypothetical protein